jgi:hypothetical protein
MNQASPGSHSEPADTTATPASWHDTVGRIGTDWWATIVAGVITLLAVTNVLPKIGW